MFASLCTLMILMLVVMEVTSQYAACPIADSTRLRVALEVTRVQFNTSSNEITFNATDSFTLYQSGDSFRVDYTNTDGDVVALYSNSGRTFSLNTASDSCSAGSSTEGSDVFTHAQILKSIVVTVSNIASWQQNYAYRGIPTLMYASVGTITPVPSVVGSFDYSSLTGNAYAIQPRTDSFNFQQPAGCGTLKFLNLSKISAGIETTVSVTFDLIGLDVDGTDIATAPSACTGATPAPPPPSTAVPSPTSSQTPMPALPTAYTARILTTEVETGDSYTMVSSYDATSRRAQVVVTQPLIDFLGRATEYTWDIFGADRTAYSYTVQQVPTGASSLVSEQVRNYFWPDSVSCVRGIFDADLVSGSLDGLLLALQDASSIVFMGVEIVRGFPARRWQLTNGSMVVDWYWANTTWSTTRRDAPDDVLVRITVRGTGVNPLFTAHPFYQQGSTLQDGRVTERACESLYPEGFAQCSGAFINGHIYYHVHDIIDFIPSSALSTTVPDICSRPTSTLVFTSFDGNDSSSLSTGEVVAIIILMIVMFILGMCCQWCRMTPRMREIEEELHEAVKLMHEHKQQLDALHSEEQPQQQAQEATV